MTSRRGSHAVEFAIVLPILLSILSGIFDYGWIMLHRHLAADAADVGARAGAIATDEEDATALAEAAANARWDAMQLPSEATVDVRTSGDRIEVELQFGDVRLLKLAPGPNRLVVVRSRLLEEVP